MKPEIASLLDQQRSEDNSIREDAILKIAMLLEKNFLLPDTSDPGTRETWRSILDESLLALRLDGTDLSEIVGDFSRQLQAGSASPSLFWALAKGGSLEALPPILVWMQGHVELADEETIRQALFSVENLVLAALRGNRLDEARSILARHNARPLLDRTSTRNQHRLGVIAGRILAKASPTAPQPHATDAGSG